MNAYVPTIKEVNFLANYYKVLRNQVYLALKYLEKKHVKNKEIRVKVVENISNGKMRCYVLDNGDPHLQLGASSSLNLTLYRYLP